MVAPPSLPSGFMGPSISQSNPSNYLGAPGMAPSSPPSEYMGLSISQSNLIDSMKIPYSPTYSSSSLSEPPTEPNSPILFHINGIIKSEAAEDNFDIPSELADNKHPIPTTTFTTPPGRGTRTRMSGDRKIDPCADEGWVVALRIANAADQMGGFSNDLTATHTRNLRKTSGRLNRASNASSATGSPTPNTSLNGTPRPFKKRGRSNTRTHSNNIVSDGGIMAIKREMFETGEGVGINNSVTFTPSTGERRRGKPPAKKQKAGSAPIAVSELTIDLHDSRTNEGKESTNSLTMNETTPVKRKKRPKRLTYAYVIEELEESKPDDGTRGSVPPNFTFRYAIPHTPFSIDKEPLRSSGYWSEGAEDPGNLKPIGDIFQRKDGLLTDIVSIIESRLRPRRLAGNLNLGGEPEHEPEADGQAEESTKKRTLDERGSESEESSDDDHTDTENEDLSDEMDDLDTDSEDIDPSASMDGDAPENSLLKRQKLNTGGILFTGATRKMLGKEKQKKHLTNRKDVDKRTWDGAVSCVDGIYMVPMCCTK